MFQKMARENGAIWRADGARQTTWAAGKEEDVGTHIPSAILGNSKHAIHWQFWAALLL